MKMTVFCKTSLVLEKAIPQFMKLNTGDDMIIDPQGCTIELTVPTPDGAVSGMKQRKSLGTFDVLLEVA